MKNKLMKYGVLIIAAMLLVAMAFVGVTSATWDGKTVDKSWYEGHSSPYHISTENQLAGLAEIVNDPDTHHSFEGETIYLDADLDLGNNLWTPIGQYVIAKSDRPFDGTFDGQGHTIKNLQAADDILTFKFVRYLGLFGLIKDSTASIKNLNIDGVSITRRNILLNTYIGAIAGSCKGTIENCHITNLNKISCIYYGTISKFAGGAWIGGLVGESYGTIKDCSVSGNKYGGLVEGGNGVGGLAGVTHAPVSNCWTDCKVYGNDCTGGLIGEANAAVSNCRASGDVLGSKRDDTTKLWRAGDKVGGLIGSVNENVPITNCEASGYVSGYEYVGGLIGWNKGTVTDCAASGTVRSSNDEVGGLIGKTYGDVTGSHATGYVNSTGRLTTDGVTMAGDCVGGLIGLVTDDAKIQDCYATGDVDGNTYVGGLIGKDDVGGSSSDALIRCYATGNVIGHKYDVGGLVGYANVIIDRCSATGSVTSSVDDGRNYLTGGTSIKCYVGGLVGEAERSISNSNASGAVSGKNYVGGLVGQATSSHDVVLTNCEATGNVIGTSYIGGLAGTTNDNVINCHASGDVSGTSNKIGGLIGVADRTGNAKRVEYCYATGSVTGSGFHVGGLIGSNAVNVLNCYATGDVTSNSGHVGGLIGHSESSHSITIENTYASGNVIGTNCVGGLAGYVDDKVSLSYASGTVTGVKSGKTPKPTELSGYAGGLIGYAKKTVSDCYATGNVTGFSHVGGLTGYNNQEIKHCYATGSVNGENGVGGITGTSDDDVIQSAAMNPSVSGTSKVGTLIGERTGGKSINCNSWRDIEKTGSGGTDSASRYSSVFIWETFPNDFWGNLCFNENTWKANSGNDLFELPILIGTGYDTSSDARHLIPHTICTVEFNVQGHGTTPETQYVAKMGKATKPADPIDKDYQFAGWYTESTCTNAWNFDTYPVVYNTTLYAKWEMTVKHTVIFDVLGHGTAPEPQYVATGNLVTKPADPEDLGWTFNGWYTEPACTNIWNFDTDTVSKPLTLYANWTQNTCLVEFDVQGNGTAPSPQYVASGQNATRPTDPTDEKYTLENWYKEPVCTNIWNFDTEIITSDTTIYANWTPKNVVSFDVQGHGTAPASQYIVTGENATEPEQPQENRFAFKGWYTEPACTNAWNFTDAITQDTPLYANWTPTYVVIFNLQGHGSELSPQIVEKDQKAVRPTTPSDDNYTLEDWYTEPECTNIWDFNTNTVTGDTILYANWTGKPHTITFEKHNEEPAVQEQYAYGSIITEPAVPEKSGYSFDGWYTKETGGSRWNFASDFVTEDMTLHAQWTQTGHTITVTGETNCIVDVSQYSAAKDDAVFLTVLPDSGYGNPTITASCDCPNPVDLGGIWLTGFSMPDNDVTISVAATSISSYTVTLQHTGNGSIIASPLTCYANETVALAVLADENYAVKNNSVNLSYPGTITSIDLSDAGSYLEGTFTMPASDVTVNADFIKTVFTITSDTGDHGDLFADRAKGSAGETVNFTIIPDAGYAVDTFTVNGADKKSTIIWTGNEGRYTCTVENSDLIAAATFIPNAGHTVTVQSATHGSIKTDKTAAGTGETIRVTLASDKGYQVQNAQYSSSSETKSLVCTPKDGYSLAEFVMPDDDVIVTGTFEPMEVNVSFNIYGTGTVTPSSATVTYGEPYGTLPTASRSFNAFDGWYHNIEYDGSEVTADSQVTIPGDHSLYAKWIGPLYLSSGTIDFGTLCEGDSSFNISDAVNNTFAEPVTLSFPSTTAFTFVNTTDNTVNLTGTELQIESNMEYWFDVIPRTGLPAGFYAAEINITYGTDDRSMGSIPVTLSVLSATIKDSPQTAMPQLPVINSFVGGADITGSVRIIWVDDSNDFKIYETGGSNTSEIFNHNLASNDRTIIQAVQVYDPKIDDFSSFAPLPHSQITAQYPTKSLSNGGSYKAVLTLKEVSANLPTLSGTYNESLASKASSAGCKVVLATVSALNTEEGLTSMNKLIADDGVSIAITIPASQIPDTSKVTAYHIDNAGTVEEREPVITLTQDGSAYLITATGPSFSGYVFGLTDTPHYSSGSSSRNSGYTVILPENETIPTVTPTIAPTSIVNPSIKPTTQPTQSSPAPIAGIIAGLGAAALILRRLRD